MNNDVMILREKVVRLTQMLSDRGIIVTQRGTEAYVESDPRTGRPKRVNLPFVPDTASEDLISAIEGFLDHEVAHLLFSDFMVIGEAHRLGTRIAILHNIVEDTFVERKMTEKFPGSGYNLAVMGHFFSEEVNRPLFKQAMMNKDQEAILGSLMVPMMRAWAGQQVFIDFMEGKWELVEKIVARIGTLKDRVPLVQSSKEALDLALAIEAAIYPPKPKSSTKGEKTPSIPKNKEEPTPPEEPQAGEGDEGDGHGSTEQETCDSESESEPEDIDAGNDEPAGNDDTSGDAAADESDGVADDEGDADPEPTGAAGSTEPAGGDDADPEPVADADLDEDDAEGDGDGGSGGPGDGEEDGELSDGETAPGCGGFEDLPEDFLSRTIDFDKSVGEKISGDAADAMRSAEYRLFTKDFDIVDLFEVPEDFDMRKVVKMDDRTRSMVGVMQKDLERMMAAQSKVIKSAGQRKGRVHGASLHRLAANDARVFYKKEEHRSKETAVTLLIDCSGSMTGSPIETACTAAYALSSVLERIGVKHEILGFTTKGLGGEIPGLTPEMIFAEQQRVGFRFTRWEALYMPIFKEVHERLTPQVKARLAAAPKTRGLLQNNIDGECVEIATRRLLSQRAERRVLIVLSDGNPACNGDMRALYEHLKRAVKNAEVRGVECIGIGIEDDSVRHFYPKHVVLNRLDQLPGEIMAQLKSILAPM
ncbi:cobaltochelatase CobT-related protein [Magnetospirillum molischianum]|uniref:Putative Porphyrin biosynthetic protein n=1 Tax=Magnetospirillum molischianum DSM 120 TaxID=1150626 RepID=H8FY87_MAGML|nr:Porphyrin biosynthetic protein [Magnetospirillum molischianum]CCG43325.1 putative Porphyrin biosynthetic protein [Magnetospirillum molischianum DSM 120]